MMQTYDLSVFINYHPMIQHLTVSERCEIHLAEAHLYDVLRKFGLPLEVFYGVRCGGSVGYSRRSTYYIEHADALRAYRDYLNQ